MCPQDLAWIAEGYMMKHRDEWERAILHANSTGMLKKPLSYDDLFKPTPKGPTIETKEDWEAFKARFKGLKKKETHDG